MPQPAYCGQHSIQKGIRSWPEAILPPKSCEVAVIFACPGWSFKLQSYHYFGAQIGLVVCTGLPTADPQGDWGVQLPAPQDVFQVASINRLLRVISVVVTRDITLDTREYAMARCALAGAFLTCLLILGESREWGAEQPVSL